MVSVVLRQTILPLVTPDELRGRVNAVEMVFISASNELGAFESGVAAALVGAVPAVVIGGVITVAIAVGWSRFFPALARVDRLDELRPAAVDPAERLVDVRPQGTCKVPGRVRRGRTTPGLVGEHDGLGAIAQVELLEDPRDVRLHGVLADHEVARRSRRSRAPRRGGAAPRARGR